MDKHDLTKYIAPLVSNRDNDEYAKRFDNFMYGMMLANIEQLPTMKHLKNQLVSTAELLERKVTIPQVQKKLTLIKDIQTDEFWVNVSVLTMETVRRGGGIPIIFTKLDDPVIENKEGEQLDPAYDFEDYRKKVNRYVEEHKDNVAIYKLNHNL